MTVVVAGLLFWGAKLFFARWAFGRESVQVTGEVVGMDFVSDSDGVSSPVPVVTFRPPQGEPITFTSRYFSAFSSYKVGDKVPVLFHAPSGKARIQGFGSLWFAPLLVIGMGLALWLFGWLPLLHSLLSKSG